MTTLHLKRPLDKRARPTNAEYTALQHRLSRYGRGMMVTFAASHDVRSPTVIVWAAGEITAVLR